MLAVRCPGRSSSPTWAAARGGIGPGSAKLDRSAVTGARRQTIVTTGRPSVTPAAGQAANATVHSVWPLTADPHAGGPGYPDMAMVAGPRAWNGKLVVFLPGTGDEPSCCRLFLTQAAGLGFHVIGLTYDNSTAVGLQCLNDLSCYGTVHQDVFTGADHSRYSRVRPRDGVEHRLVALLSYLRRTYPDEGWGHFLAGGLPAYADIVMAGHSQGGAEAAFIASRRRVAGVVMLSSPPDTDSRLRPATWLGTVPAGQTPISHYFGFVNQADPYIGRIRADWEAMGLTALGPPAPADGASSAYYRTHELVSSAPVPEAGPSAAHNSTADDDAQPLCPAAAPATQPSGDTSCNQRPGSH